MTTQIQSIGTSGALLSPVGHDGSQSKNWYPSSESGSKFTNDQINDAVHELNKAMQSTGTSLSFSIDSTTKRVVVTVMDTNTKAVIRQIPPEEMLRVSQRIAELIGILFDHEG